MPIEGRVADILDRTTLVANVGEEDGVEPGMEFRVYEVGPMVTDPDTGEELGRPITTKITVVASDVQENMTVMNTKSYTVTEDPMRDIMGTISSFSTGRTVTKQSKMKTDASVREDRKIVRVGDSLRQIVSEEDDEDAVTEEEDQSETEIEQEDETE